MSIRQGRPEINDLPLELLLGVFSALARLPPVTSEEEEAIFERRLPFRTYESPGEAHPGLRAYPFLGQVCKRWRELLKSRAAQAQLWRELVLDFGHELITSVHTPVAWSDRRPGDDEFRAAFASTRLDAHRILNFVRDRRGVIRKLVLMHSEGYWANEAEFVNLASKHTFGLAHFGLMLGMLSDTLEELRLIHCNDLFNTGSPLPVIASLGNLKTLMVEDCRCRLFRDQVAELGRLTSLEWLSVCTGERTGVFVFGMDQIPCTWQRLSQLRALELRGNALIDELPAWMPAAMPALRLLDVSFCSRLDLASVVKFTQLEVLALQGMGLIEEGRMPSALAASVAAGSQAPRIKLLPDLSPLAPSLTAINLSDNFIDSIPTCLSKLGRLQVLDLSGNAYLKVLSPATFLLSLKDLRWLDLRGILAESGDYWSPEKCTTMQNVAALAKVLRRKRGKGGAKRGGAKGVGASGCPRDSAAKVLFDTS